MATVIIWGRGDFYATDWSRPRNDPQSATVTEGENVFK